MTASFIIILGGSSMLDISTRLRITEAELAIVRNEVSELVAEKATLEAKCREHENSWKFALHQLGRTIEQRNEALAQIQSPAVITRDTRSPEVLYLYKKNYIHIYIYIYIYIYILYIYNIYIYIYIYIYYI